MGLVIAAALCVAAFAVIFRLFERHHVPLFPAITINYFTAFLCGLAFHPPWRAGDLSLLWMPSALLGVLFVSMFTLTGISAQKAGAARTNIAGRMSLVLTVGGTLLIFHERPGTWTIIGIVVALIGFVLTTRSAPKDSRQAGWWLPVIIFLGSAAADIGVNGFQRVRTTSMNEGAFTTLCFGGASAVSACALLIRGPRSAIFSGRTWIGGAALGVVNYASLLLLVLALGDGSLPASSIFPLMNIVAILFGTPAAMMLFGERMTPRQWTGIALCIAALVLIMLPSS